MVGHVLVLVGNHAISLVDELLQHGLVALYQAQTPDTLQQVIPSSIHLSLGGVGIGHDGLGLGQSLLKGGLGRVGDTGGVQTLGIGNGLLQQGLVGGLGVHVHQVLYLVGSQTTVEDAQLVDGSIQEATASQIDGIVATDAVHRPVDGQIDVILLHTIDVQGGTLIVADKGQMHPLTHGSGVVKGGILHTVGSNTYLTGVLVLVQLDLAGCAGHQHGIVLHALSAVDPQTHSPVLVQIPVAQFNAASAAKVQATAHLTIGPGDAVT